MTKWRVTATFELDIGDDEQAREIARIWYSRPRLPVPAGTTVGIDRGQSPGMFAQEAIADPARVVSAVAEVLFERGAETEPWVWVVRNNANAEPLD
jgi:hypothetical protein